MWNRTKSGLKSRFSGWFGTKLKSACVRQINRRSVGAFPGLVWCVRGKWNEIWPLLESGVGGGCLHVAFQYRTMYIHIKIKTIYWNIFNNATIIQNILQYKLICTYIKPLHKLTKAFRATTKNEFTRVQRCATSIKDKSSLKTTIKYCCILPQIL